MTVQRLLFEAYRRNDIADSHERAKPLEYRWLGLGTASMYRSAINGGFMQFQDGRTPPKRCMGWLVLTATGIEAFKEMTSLFKQQLESLKNDSSYRLSYASMYSLVSLCP